MKDLQHVCNSDSGYYFVKIFHKILKEEGFSSTMYLPVNGMNAKLHRLLLNPFQPSVAFYIETSHLSCTANQMIWFYMKCNTGLKQVNRSFSRQGHYHTLAFVYRFSYPIILFDFIILEFFTFKMTIFYFCFLAYGKMNLLKIATLLLLTLLVRKHSANIIEGEFSIIYAQLSKIFSETIK